MSTKFSVFLPTGFTLDYMGIPDPVVRVREDDRDREGR